MCTLPSSPGDGSRKLIPQRGHYSAEPRDPTHASPAERLEVARRKWNVRDRGTGRPELCGKTFPGHIFNFKVLLKPGRIRKGFGSRRLGRLSAKRQGKS